MYLSIPPDLTDITHYLVYKTHPLLYDWRVWFTNSMMFILDRVQINDHVIKVTKHAIEQQKWMQN